jgi:hypothetical protein
MRTAFASDVIARRNVMHWNCPVTVRSVRPAAALSLFAAASTALAAAAGPVSFEYKDWALQCDNTRTCRASGYQDESGDSQPVSMLISRVAGPGTPVTIEVGVYSEEAGPDALQLSVGRKVFPKLQGNGGATVPARDVPELLRQLLNADTATVHGGKETWTLSLAGIKAVLLKMDEAQGRVGTPGALVRRGEHPESSVLPPLPAPKIKAVKPLPERAGDEALGRRIYAAFAKADQETVRDSCNGQDVPADEVAVYRLDGKRLLISVPCGMGAYNFSSLLWIANDREPYQPRAVEANGDFDPASGSVHSSMKGRGIGDCWSTEDWQWDGRDFVLSGRGDSGMCRGFPGGAWSLPSYVTE